MTRDEVYEICKKVAPRYKYDPILILAICEQESAYDHTEVRLEQNFYRRYIRKQEFATTVEVLFSASYGLMQVMGWSLHKMGCFRDPLSVKTLFNIDFNVHVTHKLDLYMVNPEKQVEYGTRWLKLKQGLGTIEKGLERYNGSSAYPPQVLTRYEKLKVIYG